MTISLKIVFCMKVKLKSYCIINFPIVNINVYTWISRQRKHLFQIFGLKLECMPHNKIVGGLWKDLNNCSWKRKLHLNDLLVFITEERERKLDGFAWFRLWSSAAELLVASRSLGDREEPGESIQAFVCGLRTLSLTFFPWNIWESCFEVECWKLGNLSEDVSCLLASPYRIFALTAGRWENGHQNVGLLAMCICG